MINKDIMWYVKSIIEAIMLFIFMACLIGFIASLVIMFFCQKEWVNILMGCSVCIGVVNSLFLFSCDKEWRRDYRDEKDANEYG